MDFLCEWCPRTKTMIFETRTLKTINSMKSKKIQGGYIIPTTQIQVASKRGAYPPEKEQ